MENILRKKINSLNTILALLIVILHANATSFLPKNGISMKFAKKFFYLINSITDIAVPIFFFLSAFLFWRFTTNIWETYRHKILKRGRSILIPYFLWGILWFMAFFIVRLILPNGKELVSEFITDLSVSSIIQGLLLGNYDPPIWFLRTLFILFLISPVLYWFGKKFKHGWLICLLLMITNCIIMPKYSTPMFWSPAFMFGIYLAQHEDQIINKQTSNSLLISFSTKSGQRILVMVFSFLCISTLFFQHDSFEYYIYRNLGSLVFLLFFIFNDTISEINFLETRTFIIFCMHYPIVRTILQLSFKIFPVNYFTVAFVWVSAVTITILLIIILCKLLQKICPQLYKILNGGR
ncbi:hypothetical protein ABB41_04690 [Lactococcus lactis]|uniref:acyltransferase family protein n=1 Tax=Lactococcus lactis TaxID=1358 RepID=UPI0007609D52|nr:acyltransferase [Lactococcus lactis]KWT48651.1 hypothetical protein ABB41_04690 [Lactococcus lactis]MDT2875304.1 acyltransferase [Lactococcus lactis]